MKDFFGREISYLRISVTDRCNLSCRYCMAKDTSFSENVLSYDEIIWACSLCAEFGISNIKITGGEPLVREGVCGLIGSLKRLGGIERVTLTTNGILAEKYAAKLSAVGVDSVNVSLDTLDGGFYSEITGGGSLGRALRGIEALEKNGICVNINTVLHRRKDIYPLLEYVRSRNTNIRFIELMPIGEGARYKPVLNSELKSEFEELVRADFSGTGPAEYFSAKGFKGKIGFISPISGCFCSTCNRIRLTCDGFLKGCLCSGEEIYIRDKIYNRELFLKALENVIENKPKGGFFEGLSEISNKRRMNSIGG